MAHFTKIGHGSVHTSKKTGNQSINLQLDKHAQKALMSHDWEKGIYIFRDKAEKGKYTVMVPMPDDYTM